jgi:hypothetical protein
MATKKTAAAEPLSLGTALAQIAKQKPHLDQLDDHLANVITRVEVVLRMHVNIRVEHVIASSPPNDVRLLTFAKHKGSWGLYIETGREDPDGEFHLEEATQLGQCSREIRSRVFERGQLEELFRVAAKQIERQIAEREEAVLNADNLLEMISEYGPRPEPLSSSSGSDDDLPF